MSTNKTVVSFPGSLIFLGFCREIKVGLSNGNGDFIDAAVERHGCLLKELAVIESGNCVYLGILCVNPKKESVYVLSSMISSNTVCDPKTQKRKACTCFLR